VCLAVPGRILSVDEQHPLRQGSIDFGGVRKEICLAYVPEAGVGDYVLVHVGFAISRIDEAEAHETLRLLDELAASGAETT